jgi:hypothetical protein
MDSLRPIVLEVASIADLIEYIVSHRAPPNTLIVCSSRAAFVENLQHSRYHASDFNDNEVDERLREETSPAACGVELERFAPTLRMLSESRNVRVVFCSDVAQLRGYLAVYSTKATMQQEQPLGSHARVPLLTVLNPIGLHRHTSDFSARGLNRTMSVAVEAASQSHSKLVLVEIFEAFSSSDDAGSANNSPPEATINDSSTNPWLEEISMMNVTTKAFGIGDRGWVGRTVTIGAVLERWCCFKKLSDLTHTSSDEHDMQ